MSPKNIKGPLILCILDGWGVAKASEGNAITKAAIPNFTRLWNSFPHTLLQTAGPSVGLPEDVVGNSEVGHLNLGAGRIVFQDILRINKAIADGSFFNKAALTRAITHITNNNSNIHLLGLAGTGLVHSAIDHLYAILGLLKRHNIPSSRIKIHLFTDGRDTPPTLALSYIAKIESHIEKNQLGEIASISGRYFAMDRDNRWDRTEKTYLALLGKSPIMETSAKEIISNSYLNGKTDEFIEPSVVVNKRQEPVGPIKEDDAVIFFNFRADRTRQLTRAFVSNDFATAKTSSGETVSTFERGPKIPGLFVVSMTEYAKDFPVSAVAFSPILVEMPLAQFVSERNFKQLHIAETEKYAHVTYFFNGGREEPFPGEDRILIDSKKVPFYDQTPQMSAPEITERLIETVRRDSYDFIVVNFANADMVAHTGNLEATITAVETLDKLLGQLKEAVFSKNGGLIITADHGNAEVMTSKQTGSVDTEHSDSPAPLILALDGLQGKSLSQNSALLADVAPTILAILGIPKPPEMTGVNLIPSNHLW